MIRKIIRFSAENRYVVIVATIIALLIAIWTMNRIPLDALPAPLRRSATEPTPP